MKDHERNAWVIRVVSYRSDFVGVSPAPKRDTLL